MPSQPAETLGTGANIPAQTLADEGVLLLALQSEAVNLLVELAEFDGILDPFGNACGQGGTLSPVDASAM